MPATVKVTVWLTPERAVKLDRIRGDATRAEALRGLLDWAGRDSFESAKLTTGEFNEP